MDSSNDTGRRKLAQKRAAALRPDPLPRQGGSAAHRSQQNLSRTLGQDPLARHATVNPSRVQPKAETPKLRSRQANTSRQHP